MDSWKRVTLCGGGNGAHALLAALLAGGSVAVTHYLPLEEEYERFRAAQDRRAPFVRVSEGRAESFALDQVAFTRQASEAAEADAVFLVAPAFAHETFLTALAPFLRPGVILAVMPARGGLEFQAPAILDRGGSSRVIVAVFQTLPWACRVREYAGRVEVFGRKQRVTFAAMPSRATARLAVLFGDLLDMECVPCGSLLEITLGNPGQVIHPGIMVGAFAGRMDARFRAEDAPAFYTEVDESVAELLNALSGEILRVSKVIAARAGVPMPTVRAISEWLMDSYGNEIGDASSLARMFQTNRSYRALRVPVRPAEDGLLRIDPTARYITEDVPFGLLVSRALGELADVAMPAADRVIEQAARWMGVEYLRHGGLDGKDLSAARIPQRYGLNRLEDVIAQAT